MNITKNKYMRSKPELVLKVYAKLIKVAHAKSSITYGEIAKIMGLRVRGNSMSREVGQILGEISEFEHREGRPMLSAVVIREDLDKPGNGFFKLAKDLKGITISDEITFWKAELEEVYKGWV
jgi:hypothetical protein